MTFRKKGIKAEQVEVYNDKHEIDGYYYICQGRIFDTMADLEQYIDDVTKPVVILNPDVFAKYKDKIIKELKES